MSNWPPRERVDEAMACAGVVAENEGARLGREMAIVLRDEVERLRMVEADHERLLKGLALLGEVMP